MADILASDDSACMRQMVAFALDRAGHGVIEAVDGKDALEKAEAGPVDIVLTDVNMPNRDGSELIRQLHALPIYKFTPMLLATTESASPHFSPVFVARTWQSRCDGPHAVKSDEGILEGMSSRDE